MSRAPRKKGPSNRASPPRPVVATDATPSIGKIVGAWWPALILIAVGVIVYANSLWGVFLFDDAYAIVDNTRIRQLFPADRWIETERPVVELSLAVNYAIGKLSVTGYHVFNLLVHIAAGLTLFGVVRRTIIAHAECGVRNAETRTAAQSQSRFSIHHSAFFIALAVALLWLVHPLQTESVTYVIQRAESLMGLLYLLTIYLFVRGAQSTNTWLWHVAAVVVCALGMATKAVMVTAPVLVLLYDRFFLAGSFRESWRRRGGFYLWLGLTWGVLFACGIVQHVFTPVTDRTAIGFGFKGISPWEYALTQTGVILHYLRLSLWPQPLCLDYAWPVARSVSEVLVPSVIILGLLLLTFWAFIRKHWIGFVGAWFFLILAPTSSVIPVRDVAFEHRMYLPLAAVIVAIVAGFNAVWNVLGRKVLQGNTSRRWVEGVVILGVAAVLGSCTVRRNRDYHDDLGMWKNVAEQRPDNARAHVNIGVLLEQRGHVEEAIEEYRIALAMDPDYADAHYNLGVAQLRLNRAGEAEQAFGNAIRLSPGDAPAQVNLGNVYYQRGDWDAAAKAYAEALRIAPGDQDARLGLARTLVRKSQFDEAVVEYQRVLQSNPNSAVIHLDLGNAYIRKGDFPAAVKEFREAARLDRSDIISRINLGTALNMEGKTEEAFAVFQDALRIDPNHPDVHFNMAEALLDQGKNEEAVEEFRLVLRARPLDAGVRVAIGRALMRMGRLEDAVEQFREALALDPNHADAKQGLEYALSKQTP